MRITLRALTCAVALSTSALPGSAQQTSPILTSPASQGSSLGVPADPSAPFRPAIPSQPISAGTSTAPVATVAPPASEADKGPASPDQPIVGVKSGKTPPSPSKEPVPATPQADVAPKPVAPRGPAGLKTTEYGDWTLECSSPAVAGVRCQATSKVLAADTKQSVLVFSLAYLPALEASRVQIALPLGFSLPQGVQLDIGSAYQSSIEVNRCTAQGCLVEGDAAPQLVAAMRREKEGAVTIRTIELVPIRLPLSLKGFAPAMDAMLRENAKEMAGQ